MQILIYWSLSQNFVHDTTDMLCKICCNLPATERIREQRIYYRISIKFLVKQAPGWTDADPTTNANYSLHIIDFDIKWINLVAWTRESFVKCARNVRYLHEEWVYGIQIPRDWWTVLTIDPWELWVLFWQSDFQVNFSDWWLRYLFRNCHQLNVTGPYRWLVNIG